MVSFLQLSVNAFKWLNSCRACVSIIMLTFPSWCDNCNYGPLKIKLLCKRNSDKRCVQPHQREQVYGAKHLDLTTIQHSATGISRETMCLQGAKQDMNRYFFLSTVHSADCFSSPFTKSSKLVVLWEIALVPISQEESLNIPCMVRTDKTDMANTWNPSKCLVE